MRDLKFLRIDADVNDTLCKEVKEEDKEALKKTGRDADRDLQESIGQ